MSDKAEGEQTSDSSPPIEKYAAAFTERFPGDGDPWRALAQLGVPPDLRYLQDGLSRSAAIIRQRHVEIDELLEGKFDEAPMGCDALLVAIDSMQKLASDEQWSGFGSVAAKMERATESDQHPLRKYCLSTLHLWSLLFYTTPKNLTKAYAVDNPVESAVEDFAPFVLAAQALVPAKRYSGYCATWWRQGKLPDIEVIPVSAIASRLRNATLAIRRLGTPAGLPLLKLLTAVSHDDFCSRLAAACTSNGLSDKENGRLNDIALLVESLQPDWRTPGRRRRGITDRRRSASREIEDGYTRVAPMIVGCEIETESGIVVSSLYRESDSTDGDDDSADDEFMPLGDRVVGESISTFIVSTGDTSGARVSAQPIQSRWAAEHVRRDCFAHAMHRARVLDSDVDAIWAAMQSPPDDADLRELIVRLHASLVHSIPVRETGCIVFSGQRLDANLAVRTVVYRTDLRIWEIRLFPPAYRNMETLPIERAVGEWLQLADVTSFGLMLDRYGFGSCASIPDRPLGVRRMQKLAEWMERVTGDRHATVSGCANYMFHRALRANRGDLGAAHLLTGASHSHARSVIHYSHYSQLMLAEIFRDALRSPSLPAFDNQTLTTIDDGQAPGFGARRVPKVNAVRKLVVSLRESIKSAIACNDLIRWHNSYTTYTIVAMTLGLALRAIRDPHLLDIGHLLTTFVDKARTDYHRRVVATPALLLAHMHHYAEFRKIVDARYGANAFGPDMAFAYLDPTTRTFEPYRPKHFLDVVGDTFPLELYSLRRFVRTSLLEVPSIFAEDIDAWMGHWHEGVGPHDPRSTYPVRRLIDLAQGPVSEMLTRVDLQPLRSIL